MAYTQSDLDLLDKAILDFALGRRKETVVIGEHTVRFAEVTLADLQNLRSVVASQLSSSYKPRAYASNGGRG